MLLILTAVVLPFLASFLAFHCAGSGCACLPVLTTFILIPNLAALAILVAGEKFIRWVSLVAASLELGLAFHILTSFSVAVGGFQFVEKVPWLSNLGINYLLGVDGMSTLMVFLVASVYFAGSLISWNITLRTREYFVLFSLLVGGVAGAYVSLDLFFFFLFYEFAVLPMYLLVGIWDRAARNTRP